MPAIARRHLPGLLATATLFACAAPPVLARTGPESFAPLVRQVMPSVVNIAVTETVAGRDPLSTLPPELRRQFHDRFRAHNERVQGAGSGFIIDPSGIIVTNNHVVGNADRIVVGLSDGTQLPAKLIGADELTDVAVIKVNAPGPLPAARWGDSQDVQVGDWVIAAGNPFALGGSVTAGIISARGRDIGAGPFDDFIQIDAPINPGNSGGPLFNEDGEVVGMNSAIYSPTGGSVGIGFAIPSALVRKIVEELRVHGHIDRGWLGVSVQDMPARATPAGGVVVEAVEHSGPAARSGVRAGDVVLKLNGQTLDSARSLTRTVALTPPGGTVQLVVRRQGRDLSLPVIVGKRPKIEEN
jgi:serine protease Do